MDCLREKKAGACACSKNGLTSPQVQATSGRDEQTPGSSAMSFHLRYAGISVPECEYRSDWVAAPKDPLWILEIISPLRRLACVVVFVWTRMSDPAFAEGVDCWADRNFVFAPILCVCLVLCACPNSVLCIRRFDASTVRSELPVRWIHLLSTETFDAVSKYAYHKHNVSVHPASLDT